MNRALITGITGQDGSYLAELLLEKGYEVHGIVRRASTINTSRIDHIFNHIKLHYGDMTDGSSLLSILIKIQPHEIYNLAAQSHVKVSFEIPEYTASADALGTLRLLEAVRSMDKLTPAGVPRPSIYNACTSEMFGSSPAPQSETTPMHPCSPYGSAKLYSYWIAKNYRESYDMFISNGILFNHESPRRGETFVTRKVTKAAARIKLGLQDKLIVGNLEALRDWGHAKDYVESMWLMLQHNKPDDFVIATGQSYSVRDLINYAFARAGIIFKWEGDTCIEYYTGRVIVECDYKYNRPNEVTHLRGNAQKARKQLGWAPKYDFKMLINEMVDYDMKEALNEVSPRV